MTDVILGKSGRRVRRVKSKFEVYTYNAQRAHEILDDLIGVDLIKASYRSFSYVEQMWGKAYCKFHNVSTHITASCIKLKDHIQELVNEGRIQFEATTNATIAVIKFSSEQKHRRKPTLELLTLRPKEEEPIPNKAKPTLKASAAVLCSRCKVECIILVSYEEFENSFKFHPKLAHELHSPPKNF